MEKTLSRGFTSVISNEDQDQHANEVREHSDGYYRDADDQKGLQV